MTSSLCLNDLLPKNRILILFVLISAFILACYTWFSLLEPATSPSEPDLTAIKVSLIMEMFNCHDPQIYQAIMASFDPVLVATVIAIESGFRTNAVSPAGARGLMQLTPDKLEDWQNVTLNIQIGAAYLQQQLQRFGDLDLAMAAYNAGPRTVIKYQGIPPYKETIRYLEKVKQFNAHLENLLIHQNIATNPEKPMPRHSNSISG